jgi:DNA-binding transcriptional MerR regulator
MDAILLACSAGLPDPAASSCLRFKEESVMRIGELARRTQTSVPTIRYYESLGVLPSPQRASGRQRLYVAADAERLDFIRRCRKLGFSLEEVASFTQIARDGADSAHCRELLQARLTAVRSEIAGLRAAEARLEELLSSPPAAAACERLAVLA